MTTIRQGLWRWTGILLALIILAGTVGTAMPTGTVAMGPAGSGGNNSQNFNATSTISTQSVADSIKGHRGIDVSRWQGSIVWSQVAEDNIHFAFIRASYGTTADPYFVSNAQLAHKNGIKVGAYHYATFKDSASARQEAQFFISMLKQVDITYPVVLDLEAHYGVSRANLTTLAIQFMDLVKAEGYSVMLYSYSNFLRDNLDMSRLEDDYDLWIANYLRQPSAYSHSIWQHTNTGRVSGINGNVDLNIAYSDLPSKGGSTKRTVTVDKGVSDSIKLVLNERYNAGLPLEGLNMTSMNQAIAKAIQMEINLQWEDASLPTNGEFSGEEIKYLNSVTFTENTSGYITWLIQAKLFYKGYYSAQLTSQFDANTREALTLFQQASGISANGEVNQETLRALFG